MTYRANRLRNAHSSVCFVLILATGYISIARLGVLVLYGAFPRETYVRLALQHVE